MEIIASDAARAAIEIALNANGLTGLAEYLATVQVTYLPTALWHYDAATRTLSLSDTLFEDDTVPLCQTDEMVQAAQRQVALERVLQAATASVSNP